jgi:hypothetical protein
MNMWLPVARDGLIDQLCGGRTHPEAGLPGGNPGSEPAGLAGCYEGSGNLLRQIHVSHTKLGLRVEFSGKGLQSAPMEFALDQDGLLIPPPGTTMPGLAFFAEPGTGTACIMIGISTLKKRSHPLY